MGEVAQSMKFSMLLQFVYIEQVLHYILDLRMAQEGSCALFSVTVGIYFKKFHILQMMSKCLY